MKTLFITLSFLLVITACTKNDLEDQLPPITQTGENTFGCYVDGKIFMPKDQEGYYPSGGGRPKGLYVVGGAHYFSITARNYIDFFIYIPENYLGLEEKTYIFDASNGYAAGQGGDNPQSFCYGIDAKYLSVQNSGSITFTKIDHNSGLLVGVFNLTVVNEDDPNDVIEITDGRFDIDLGTLNN